MGDDKTEKIINSPTKLSEEQKKAVLSSSRYIRVSAGAGTGKTETLTRRIVYLLLHDNVKPKEIVAFTFTEKAAQNMKSRIYSEVESLGGKEACLKLGDMYIGTIHGFCLRLLENSLDYGDFEVFDENQEMAFLLRRGWDIGLEKEHYFNSCESFLRSIKVVYDELLDLKKLEEKSPDFYKKFKVYEEVLKKNKRLSFDQLVYLAVKRMEENPGFLAYVKHLIVDEYQDINLAQERVIELIGRNSNVFVVGDPRQTIYKWRGSNENIFSDFNKIFSGSEDINLRENRRSAKKIIAVANELAKKMDYSAEKLEPLKKDEGFAGLIDFSTKDEEAEWIVKQIKDLVETRKCAKYSDIAILVRSLKISGEPFINLLRKFNVPFIVGGNSGLFQKDEVQAVARLFSWLSYKGFWSVGFGINRGELTGEELLKSAVTRWKQATGKVLSDEKIKSLKEWKQKAENDDFKTLIAAYYDLLQRLDCINLNPDDKVNAIVLANLGRFSALLSDYDVSINFGGRRGQLKTYFHNLCLFMNFYATASYEEHSEEDIGEIDAIQLLTVHQAKGLEWTLVFIPAFMEGKFPQIKVGKKQRWELSEELFDRPRYEGGENDERRLIYVAVTRAKESIVLSYHLDRENDRKSRFLEEIEKELHKLKVIDSVPSLEHKGGRDEDSVNTFVTGEIIEYFRCPLFYRFRNVWLYKPEIVEPMGYGKSLHYCLKLLSTRMQTGDMRGEVKKIVERNFSLPFAGEELKSKLAIKADKVLSDFVTKNEKDMRNIESVEVRVEFPVSKSTVVGKADVIINDETRGGIEVRDYKTSDKVITKEESDLQVRLYSIGFEALGKKVVLGSIANLEENEVRDLSVGKKDLDSAKETADNAINGILAKKFSPVPAEHCRTCDFKKLCKIGSEYLSVHPEK